MASALPLVLLPPPSEPAEARVVLHGVPWPTYVMLRDTVNYAGVRMTYLEGRLEIVSPSRQHEVSKKQIARLLELFCLERDIPLYGYGSTTFRSEAKQRGLEPDECYCRGGDRETPDVALEVVVSADAIDKLEVYRGLGVQEVWVFEAGTIRVVTLRNGAYVLVGASELFPELDLARVAHYAKEPDQHEALRAFRKELGRNA